MRGHGFSMVTLLVVIVVIGMLAGHIAPYVLAL